MAKEQITISKRQIVSMISCMHQEIMNKRIYVDVNNGCRPYVVIQGKDEIGHPYYYSGRLFCTVDQEFRCYIPESEVHDWMRDFHRMKRSAKNILLRALGEFLETEVDLYKKVPGAEKVHFDTWTKHTFGGICSAIGSVFSGDSAPFKRMIPHCDAYKCLKVIEGERIIADMEIGKQEGTLSFIIPYVRKQEILLQGVFAPYGSDGEYQGKVISFYMVYHPDNDSMDFTRAEPEYREDIGMAIVPDYIFNTLRLVPYCWIARDENSSSDDPVMQIMLPASQFNEQILKDIEKVSGGAFSTHTIEVPGKFYEEKQFVVEAKKSVLSVYSIL